VNLCLLWHPFAWNEARARHALETVAGLLGWPWRSAPLGAAIGSSEVVIYAGPLADAPPDAAAAIECTGWPEWPLESLTVARFEDAPMLAPAGGLAKGPDPRAFPAGWLRAIGFLLGAEEDRLDPRRDEWECFKGTWSRRQDVLDEPSVNRAAGQLARRIEQDAASRGIGTPRAPLWKDSARFAVALTHDVDDVSLHSWAGAFRLLGRARSPRGYAMRGGLTALARAVTAPRGRDPYWSFDRWAAEEEKRGFRSSFYFVPPDRAASHEYDPTYTWSDLIDFEGRRVTVSQMMKQLATRGFDIGLHGGYLSHRSGEELSRQKQSVERASGAAAAGIRQHFLRFDPAATWSAQDQAGFRYDTTFGFNEAVGFRAGIAAPFHPWNATRGGKHELLELPLTLMDGTLFRNLGLDGEAAARRTREHLERVEAAGGLAVLLWHPNAADEQRFPGWWGRYLATLDWLADRAAWVTHAAEIAAWWREREKTLRLEG